MEPAAILEQDDLAATIGLRGFRGAAPRREDQHGRHEQAEHGTAQHLEVKRGHARQPDARTGPVFWLVMTPIYGPPLASSDKLGAPT